MNKVKAKGFHVTCSGLQWAERNSFLIGFMLFLRSVFRNLVDKIQVNDCHLLKKKKKLK